MTTHLKKPICIYCGRGKRHSPASLGGNEPFYLVPSEVKKNGLYQGKTWNIFCGGCFGKIVPSNLDFQNLINNYELEIIIKGKKISLLLGN